MSTRRVGLWLIGACGGVGTTAALGLAALQRGVIDTTSLVTALPLFRAARTRRAGPVRRRRPRDPPRRLSPDRAANCSSAPTSSSRPSPTPASPTWNAGRPTSGPAPCSTAARPSPRLADLPEVLQRRHRPRGHRTHSGRSARLPAKRNKLDQVVVVNVSSTEPPFEIGDVHESLERLTPALDRQPDRRCRRRRSTPGPPSIWVCRTSTSRPRWAPRSRPCWSWPSNARPSSAARTARPARRS